MLEIDARQARGTEPVRDLADARTASAVLSVFSGVMWMVAAGLLFLDLRAGAVAGVVAAFMVWLSARRA